MSFLKGDQVDLEITDSKATSYTLLIAKSTSVLTKYTVPFESIV